MARIHNLPEEIISHIGIHLEKHIIRTAVLTCWRFHNALNHLLWRQLAFPLQRGQLLLSATTVEKNAHRVRSLTLRYHVPKEFYSIHFPKVHHLEIANIPFLTPPPPSYTVSPDQHQSLLISLNPQFQDLTLRGIEFLSSSTLWDTIFTTLQHPKRLEIHSSGPMDSGVQDSFWRACSQFEELRLHHSGFSHLNTHPKFLFPRLKRIALADYGHPRNTETGLDVYVDWLKNAPHLVALEWTTYGFQYFPTDAWLMALRNKTWQHLDSFSLSGLNSPDSVWADMISLLPPLKLFQTNNKQFGEQSFARLQEHHFAALCGLNVRGCIAFTSQMALSVLSECSRLEEFRGHYMYAADVKNRKRSTNQDWACVGLKFLKLLIVRDVEDPEGDELVLQQLARLNQLRHLVFGQNGAPPLPMELQCSLRQKGTLQVGLDAGLAHLSTLKRLEVFSFQDTWQNTEAKDASQRMGVEEVAWMLKNWPSLQEIYGRLSEDDDTQSELSRMFTEAGVECDHYGRGFGLFDG